jgi:hypothetical protein
MKTILRLSCAGIMLAMAGPASADGVQSVSVSSTVGGFCELTTLLSPIEFINPTVGLHSLGNLGFTCNFDSTFATLKISTTAGTFLVNGADGDKVRYRIKWDVPPVHTWVSDFAHDVEASFPGTPGTPAGTEQVGPVLVDLLETPTHAGTYSDTVTFSVLP